VGARAGRPSRRLSTFTRSPNFERRSDPGAPGERYQVVVHGDAAVLADPVQPGESVLEEVGHVSVETSRQLARDASRSLWDGPALDLLTERRLHVSSAHALRNMPALLASTTRSAAL
jgi:hypothetical protein